MGDVVLHVAQVDKPTDDVLEFQPCLVQNLDVALRHLMDLVADCRRSRTARGCRAEAPRHRAYCPPTSRASRHGPFASDRISARPADDLAGGQIGRRNARDLHMRSRPGSSRRNEVDAAGSLPSSKNSL